MVRCLRGRGVAMGSRSASIVAARSGGLCGSFGFGCGRWWFTLWRGRDDIRVREFAASSIVIGRCRRTHCSAVRSNRRATRLGGVGQRRARLECVSCVLYRAAIAIAIKYRVAITNVIVSCDHCCGCGCQGPVARDEHSQCRATRGRHCLGENLVDSYCKVSGVVLAD